MIAEATLFGDSPTSRFGPPSVDRHRRNVLYERCRPGSFQSTRTHKHDVYGRNEAAPYEYSQSIARPRFVL